jgi:hypothetical protein
MNQTKQQKSLVLQLATTAALALVLLTQQTGAYAQAPEQGNGADQISMSIFPVQRGADGKQYIITKAGYQVTVPGLGIAPNANEIAVYRDNANNFWYVDRNGVTQKVSQQQLQWTMAQINEQQQARNMAAMERGQQPMPQTQAPAGQTSPNVIIQNSQPASQGSSAGATAAMSGMAAMGGAMAGSALANSMYNNNHGYCGIPYGAPCYNQAGHAYYRGANGERVPIATDTKNPYLNQWGRQTAYHDNQQNRQNEYNNMNPNQQQTLKNAGKEGYNNRQQAKAAGTAVGQRSHRRLR